MLKGLQWPQWLPEAWYNKGCIRRLANPRKGCASIVISMSVYVSVCLSREHLRNYTCDLYRIFGACCLQSWLDISPVKGRSLLSTIALWHNCIFRMSFGVSLSVPVTLDRATCGECFISGSNMLQETRRLGHPQDQFIFR